MRGPGARKLRGLLFTALHRWAVDRLRKEARHDDA